MQLTDAQLNAINHAGRQPAVALLRFYFSNCRCWEVPLCRVKMGESGAFVLMAYLTDLRKESGYGRIAKTSEDLVRPGRRLP